jgi:hypothetical protein
MFVDAVSNTFAKPDHPLRYSWLDYLPTNTMEYPWKSLYPSIVDSLKTKPVIQTRERRQFKTANQVRRLVPSCIHREQPIVPDLPDEMYIASEYTESHQDRLTELGLGVISGDVILVRIQADLISPFSKIKTTDPTDPWHEAFAKMLLPAFAKSNEVPTSLQKEIKRLALIPLTSPNQWTGTPRIGFGGSNKIYFAFTGTTPIPESISLKLLDRTASQNATRKAFYKALGVEACPKTTVFAKIKELHQSSCAPSSPIDQLRYLFQQRYEFDDIKSWIWIPLANGHIAKASRCQCYFPSNVEFDMYRLVPKHGNVHFLSDALINAERCTVRVNNEDWKTWLARVTGARYYPAMRDATDPDDRHNLSLGLKTVLEHNPAKFLGTLRAHWNEYQKYAYTVKKDLRQCSVPCTSGATVPLCNTYLPTAEIVAEAARLGITRNALPLLVLSDDTLDEVTHRLWTFLEEFGVVSKPDLRFYGLAIDVMCTELSHKDSNKIAEVYQCIAQFATLRTYDVLR